MPQRQTKISLQTPVAPTSWSAKIGRLLSSRYTLYSIVGLFVFQAIWLALTTRYPMAFDENFHLGLIQIYSHHWLPFLTSQPPGAGVYGPVARDPSYLYHFLMSFPYRLLTQITDNFTTQVIVLRLLNVTLAAGSLFVYNGVLKRLAVSATYRHAILFIFTVIPVLPLLAAQISYDNLLLLVVALVILQSLRLHEALRHNTLDVGLLAQVIMLLMIGSLVKYPFVPIAFGIALFLLVELVLCARRMDSFGDALLHHVRGLSKKLQVTYAVALVVVSMLFAQRYVVNLIQYHDPVPDCASALTVDECLQYAPWGRDYQYAIWNQGQPRDNALTYASPWLKQLMHELFFGVYSRFLKGSSVVWYLALQPVAVLVGLGWVTLWSGLGVTLLYARHVWRHPGLRLALLTSGIYIAALFYQNYQMYLHTNVAVAIHGRYLLPVVPLLLAVFCYGYRQALGDMGRLIPAFGRRLGAVQVALACLVLLICTQGGGFTTYLLRNREEFSWPQSQLARHLNVTAQRVLDTTIIE